jgi:hypothetical protein
MVISRYGVISEVLSSLVGTGQGPWNEHETNAWYGWSNAIWIKGNYAFHYSG